MFCTIVGGVGGPPWAYLFLHYAFDLWMTRTDSAIPFERYADDVICHCSSPAGAVALRVSLEQRFTECGLRLHREKTKIVHCKDEDRRETYPDQKFDFPGYTFRSRPSRRRRGTFGVSFSPAASDKALKAIRQTIRGWTLHERSDKTLDDLARMFNASIRGWINYYRRCDKPALYPALRHIDRILARWAHRKFRSLRRHRRRTRQWLARIARRQPSLFAHWRLLQGYG
jgi:RNA-directed DNA polymerase